MRAHDPRFVTKMSPLLNGRDIANGIDWVRRLKRRIGIGGGEVRQAGAGACTSVCQSRLEITVLNCIAVSFAFQIDPMLPMTPGRYRIPRLASMPHSRHGCLAQRAPHALIPGSAVRPAASSSIRPISQRPTGAQAATEPEA